MSFSPRPVLSASCTNYLTADRFRTTGLRLYYNHKGHESIYVGAAAPAGVQLFFQLLSLRDFPSASGGLRHVYLFVRRFCSQVTVSRYYCNMVTIPRCSRMIRSITTRRVALQLYTVRSSLTFNVFIWEETRARDLTRSSVGAVLLFVLVLGDPLRRTSGSAHGEWCFLSSEEKTKKQKKKNFLRSTSAVSYVF